MPFNVAWALAGSRLVDGVNPNTEKHWRRKGVPAHRLISLGIAIPPNVSRGGQDGHAEKAPAREAPLRSPSPTELLREHGELISAHAGQLAVFTARIDRMRDQLEELQSARAAIADLQATVAKLKTQVDRLEAARGHLQRPSSSQEASPKSR